MVVTKRSEKETLFKAYSSEVEVLPSTSHHASSFICKRTCKLIYINLLARTELGILPWETVVHMPLICFSSNLSSPI